MYPLYISKENIVSIVAVLLTVAVPSAMAKLRGSSKENEVAPVDDFGADALDLDE